MIDQIKTKFDRWADDRIADCEELKSKGMRSKVQQARIGILESAKTNL